MMMTMTTKMTLLLSSILAVPLVRPKQTHEGAAWAGDAARPCHPVSPPPLRREVLVAIHAAGFGKEGHLSVARTSAQ
jgi:hypothetical protein